MDYRKQSKKINMNMDKVSKKLYTDREKYEYYIEESQRIANELLKKVTNGETEMNDMKNQLIYVNKKMESQEKRMDNHLYSRRINEVFSRYKWEYRDAHYSKILEENRKNIDIFQTEINVDNIDDPQRYEKYTKLLKNYEIIKRQKMNEKYCFHYLL
jgi:septal ring factor EnvC (AmiA/AmiB activator)